MGGGRRRVGAAGGVEGARWVLQAQGGYKVGAVGEVEGAGWVLQARWSRIALCCSS